MVLTNLTFFWIADKIKFNDIVFEAANVYK